MILSGGHISAKALADLRLPGLPTTVAGIWKRAEGEGWSFVERPDRGGGRLYDISSLPEEARRAFERRSALPSPANARPVGRPKGTDYFTRRPEVADAVEALLADRQLAAPRILELLAQRFAGLPSRRTLARFIAKLEEEKRALLSSTRNPDEYKSRHKVALGRADGSVTRANQVWELDTTKADVLTKGGRRMVLGLIDRYSRRARFLVAHSESGQAVRRLLIDAIRAWGVLPETVMTDNGSGYINASIVSALETLGIRHVRCMPGTPEDKPYIERLFGTFTRERAQLLAGFAGHNVAQAQALRSKAKKETGRALIVPEMTAEELQAVLDGWLDGVYHQREHGTTHQPPIRRWMASPVPSAAAPAEDVLRIALSRYEGAATVGKRGIRWKNGRYWCASLPTWMGRTVQIRRDEEDLGALFVFDEDGRFIDTAVNHERAGLSEQAFAMAASRQQNEWMAEQRADLRDKKRRFSFEEARDQLLRQDAERAGKLATLPPRTEVRSNAQLDSIAAAPAPVLPSAAAIEEAYARTAPRPRPAATVAERVAAADRIIAAADSGEQVDQDELKRARLFATSTAYKAEKMLSIAFGSPPAPVQTTRRHSA
jgi:putative transposase